MSDYQIETKTEPTFYFVGVTTNKSSIMKVFPRWMEAIGRSDVIMQGIDHAIHDDPEAYRQTVAQMIPIKPLTANVHRQPICTISQGIKKRENAAPKRLPEKFMPCARPRSLTGSQRKKACAAPGKAPASPTPKRNRRTSICIALRAAPVRAVKQLQTETTMVRAFRGPSLSAIQPEGT